jgi:ABC-2 type transport system ATP-binding protein
MSILEAHGLEKAYRADGKTIPAVRDLSLRIDENQVLAFLGPNGAGKTTTIKMIAGLVLPDRGHVAINGLDPHRNPEALRSVGAVMEGSRNLYWRLTPMENLAYFGVLRGLTRRQAQQRGRALLERFELTHKADTTVQKLSRGMQQKVAIAVALIHEPQLLLLDEPTLGLDVEATQVVKRLVREIANEGRAVLLTTHQLDIAEALSDRVAIIRQGQLVAEQSTQDLIRQFSGASYRLELAELDPERRTKLEGLGVLVEAPTEGATEGVPVVTVRIADPELLYPALDILRPLPIGKLEADRANLTDIFLKLVQGADHA